MARIMNPESIELIFQNRDEIVSKIVRLIPTMDEFWINKMKSWNGGNAAESRIQESFRGVDAALSSL